MRREVEFILTSQMKQYIVNRHRHNAIMVQVAAVVLAVVAMAVGYSAMGAGWTIASWASFGVSLWLFNIAACLWVKTRKREYPDEKCQMVFTDGGFSYGASGDFDVSWVDVRCVRETPGFWEIHFVHAGRDRFVVIPSDVMDSELRSLVGNCTQSVEES
jgi:hypothetical protein